MISPTMQGKRITVYVNGDPFMKGKQITLNTHQFPQFDKFCDFLTETIPNKTGGCYRRVYTPNGSEIRALDQIEAGCEYVASKDRYRKVSKEFTYREIPDRMRVPRQKGFKKIDINKIYTPVQHAIEERLRKKSGRSYYLNEQNRGLILRVHVNGLNERPACPVAIRSKERDNMNKIKETIESVLMLQPIEKIYCIQNCGGYPENFVEIHDVSELEHNGHYLVLPKNDRHLKPKYYALPGKHNFSVATSPRSGQYYLYPSFPWDSEMEKRYRHNQSFNKHKPLPSIGSSSKQSDAVSPFSNPPSQHGRGRKSKGRAQNVDYDKDEGGVYRAKGQNNARGAQQERTQREKGTPIPPGTEINKQPSVERKQQQSHKGTEPLNEERNSADQNLQGADTITAGSADEAGNDDTSDKTQ